MFKDYDKYLSTSLKVYVFVLVIVFIMKVVGLDYFGLDVNNLTLISINTFLFKSKIIYLIDFFTLYLMFYIYISIVSSNKNVKIYSIIFTFVECLLQLLLKKFDLLNMRSIIDILLMIIAPMIVNKKFLIKKSFIMIFLITFYQTISFIIRGESVTSNYNSKIMDILLNLDQMLLLVITYKVYFMKGDVKICHQEVGFSSLKKINLKHLLKKLQENLHKFKSKEKVEKLTIIIYFILSFIWNMFTLLCIIVVAMLNNTILECAFIIIAFWATKRAFGKAFHLSSMFKCFVISNLTYYVLNKVTVSIGISIFIPIMLGVGLSYVTSKFVKDVYKPLYKGMPFDVFEETILKVTDKDSVKYKVCYESYIENETDVALSRKYHYSVSGIQKIKSRINDKIRGLN